MNYKYDKQDACKFWFDDSLYPWSNQKRLGQLLSLSVRGAAVGEKVKLIFLSDNKSKSLIGSSSVEHIN